MDKAPAINKHDCNQLTGSMMWFGKQYGQACSATPIMVHPQTKPEHAATLHPDTRIITPEKLEQLSTAVRAYTLAISDDLGFTKPSVVAKQLEHFGLAGANFVAKFTTKGK